MKSYDDIFEMTRGFLHGKGVSPVVTKGKKASTTAIERFQKQTGVLLPRDFSHFYTQFADGYRFTWEVNEDTGGGFCILTLRELAAKRKSWMRNVNDFLDDPHSLDKCVDPPFRAKAFDVWHKMRSWLPICSDESGDNFCLDLQTGQIVYDQHDWFDGFGELAKTNGIIAGQDLYDFLENWSRFCFCPNSSLWWGEFGKFGAIKWEKAYFDSEFFRDK